VLTLRITIDSAKKANSRWLVSFSSSCGEGVGYWNGTPPTCSAIYFVELHSDDILTIGTNAGTLTEAREGIESTAVGVVIYGTLDAVSDERTGSFRFADGRIELELANADLWKVGQPYWFRLNLLVLFDQNL